MTTSQVSYVTHVLGSAVLNIRTHVVPESGPPCSLGCVAITLLFLKDINRHKCLTHMSPIIYSANPRSSHYPCCAAEDTTMV